MSIEHSKTIEELQLYVADMPDNDPKRATMVKTLKSVKFILKQQLLSSKLEALTASDSFREDLIKQIDEKISEYRRSLETWQQGAQSSFVGYDSKTAAKYTSTISALEDLKSSLLRNNYQAEIQGYITKFKYVQNSEEDLHLILTSCAMELADGNRKIPSFDKKPIINASAQGYREPYSLNNLQKGFSQQQNIGNYLSMEGIEYLSVFVSQKELMEKIGKLINEYKVLKQEESALTKQKFDGEQKNERINSVVRNLDKIIEMKSFPFFRNHSWVESFHAMERSVRERMSNWNHEIIYLGDNRISRIIYRNKIAKLKKNLDGYRKYNDFVNDEEFANACYAIDDLNHDHYLSRDFYIKADEPKEEISDSFISQKVDIESIDNKLADIRAKVAAWLNQMSPEVRDLYDKGLLWTAYDIYKDRDKMVALFTLKAICSAYHIDPSTLLDEDYEKELDGLGAQFEETVKQENQTYQDKYTDISSVLAQDFPQSFGR